MDFGVVLARLAAKIPNGEGLARIHGNGCMYVYDPGTIVPVIVRRVLPHRRYPRIKTSITWGGNVT